MPSVVGSSVVSRVREHWRVVALFLCLAVVMAGWTLHNSPVVYADACGAAPDWWTLDYETWIACEIANGGTATPLQAITSPVLNYIDTDLTTLTSDLNSGFSALNSATGGLSGSIISGITGAVVPSAGDFQPLLDEVNTIESEPTVQTLDAAFTTVSEFRDAVSGYTSSGAFPTGSYMYMGTTYSLSTPDNFLLGFTMFFAWLSNAGLDQGVLYAIEDIVFALVAAGSILGDLGVNIGQLGGTVHLLDGLYGEGASQRDIADREREAMHQRREWAWGDRVRNWHIRENERSERAFRGRGRYKYPGPWPFGAGSESGGGGGRGLSPLAQKASARAAARRSETWGGIDSLMSSLRDGAGVGRNWHRDVGPSSGNKGMGRPSRRGLGRRTGGDG